MAATSKLGIEKTYRINKKSVLKLEGKTNVNGFTCGCNEIFQPQRLVAEPQSDGSLNLSFSAASLSLKIKSLDCGNKIMNKDLHKALNSDKHPNITIELKKVEQDKCNRLTELKDWVKMKALTKISLNGVSKECWISITAKKFGPGQYRFIGSKTLNMTDFCVTPPVAMMGMIKVQDAITIHLDLDVSVE
ncbi:MAG: YceI family protein [Saprospiraceae bacterium]|nr:YceI family protein [Saprospiraceae bacterium]